MGIGSAGRSDGAGAPDALSRGAPILIRADAGEDVGLGHLRRSLSIAQALERRGSRCRALVSGGETALRLARAAGIEADELRTSSGGEDDLAATLAAAGAAGAAGLLVDSYSIGRDYLAQAREAGLTVAAMDDLCAFPFPCQLVVNGGLAAASLPYESTTGDTEFLLGPAYAPMRPEFWEPLPPRGHGGPAPRILLVFGGADLTALTPAAVRALDRVPEPLEVVAVVGPFARNRAAVEDAASASKHRVDVEHAPASLLGLMLGADVAVSAGGGTLLELVATGTPTLVVEVAANQAPGVAAVAREGVAVALGRMDARDVEQRLDAAVAALLRDDERRRELAQRGRQLVDGRGALRVAERLAARIADAKAPREARR